MASNVIYNGPAAAVDVFLSDGTTIRAFKGGPQISVPDADATSLLAQGSNWSAGTGGAPPYTPPVVPNLRTSVVDLNGAVDGMLVVRDSTKASGFALATSGGVGSFDAQLAQLAAAPEQMFGGVTRDSNGAATAATVTWPDGATGAYAATIMSAAFPGAVDAYTVTHTLAGTTKTFTQPTVTRDPLTGLVTNRPSITVS